MRTTLSGAVAALLVATGTSLAGPANVNYISSTAEPWGQFGNVNALNDVFGAGNWDRNTFASPGDLNDYSAVIIDGGNGATVEFQSFVDANRASIENWVAGGGSLVIGAARWDLVNDFDLGFGITLHSGSDGTGAAVDTNHPVFDGPFGATGAAFDGDSLAHDFITGAGVTALMMGDQTNQMILGEIAFGSGNVIAHGLTLPFFGEHDLWSPNSGPFLRNLYSYAKNVPEPTSLALLAMGGMAMIRRRRS